MKPNQILAAILREVRKDVDPVPPGYMSRKDFEKAWKQPKSTVQDILYSGLKKGVIHRIRLRRLGANKIKVYEYFYKAGPAPSCRKSKSG